MGCITFKGKLQMIFNKFVFALIFSLVLKLNPALWQDFLSVGGKGEEEKMEKTVFTSEKVISNFSLLFFRRLLGGLRMI